jgi:hypothetical protein
MVFQVKACCPKCEEYGFVYSRIFTAMIGFNFWFAGSTFIFKSALSKSIALPAGAPNSGEICSIFYFKFIQCIETVCIKNT